MGIVGLLGLGWIIRQLLNRNIELAAGLVFGLLFCGMVSVSAKTLLPDFLEQRLVLEGRVENLQQVYNKGRLVGHTFDIGRETVNVTPLLYEQLKERANPVVRVEVGRGSNYVYRIEYIGN